MNPGANSASPDTLGLPFDQYQRYRLVADLVERVRAERGPLEILDVGGRTAILRSFLPDDRVRLVDVEASDVPGLVLGDGGRLPFRDRAFDVVAAFDTLEHVPPSSRAAFVRECARVCRGHVMIAGPYAAPRVDEAEELLKSFMARKLGLRHRYLEEHRTYGLPDRAAVEALLAELGARVVSHGHAGLDRWLVLMCMEMYLDSDPVLRPLGERFFRFYNAALYASDHAAPVYRHVVVAALDGSEPPSAEGLLDPPRMPAGALAALTEFGTELLALDRERDVWSPEFERLETVVRGLEADLAGHKERFEVTRRDLDEHRSTVAELRAANARQAAEQSQVRATLEADLAEHARSLDAARESQRRTAREAAQIEAELGARIAAGEEVRAALEADLAGHRGALGDTRAELAGVRAERDEARGRLADVTAELDRHRAHVRSLEERIAGQDRDLVRLGAEHDEARALLAAARAELRDRWRSLKRAFGARPTF